MSQHAIPAEIEAFRRARLAAVTSPMGDAALVGTHWITQPTILDGFPGTWDLDPENPTQLRYAAPEGGTVTVDGVPVAGSLLLASASEGGAALRSGVSMRATALHWSGLGLAVRLWDEADPSVANLLAIETYPYDAAWRIEGRYASRERTVDYAYNGHGGRSEGRRVIGEVEIAVDGRPYTLLVTRNASGLTTVFGDATNGRDTYGGGRFVSVAETGEDRAVVDFNRATLPPCAFSVHFDCPLPPPQNRIQGPVRAGERRIVRR